MLALAGAIAAGAAGAAGAGGTAGTAASGGSGWPVWLVGPKGLAAGFDPTGAGLQVSTKGLLGGLMKGAQHLVERWILSGTASLVEACGRAIQAASAPSFGSAFQGELAVLEHLGAVLALLFLLFAVIQAIVRQDLSGLLRAVLLRLPVALLLGGGAAELVVVALKATDEMSSALAGSPGTAVGALVQHVAALLAGTGPTSVVDEGFAGLAVALVAAGVSLVLWLELVVRSAAIVVATLFLPLALAGIVWQESARWAKRLAETLTALVLAKLVVVAVLVLAARTVSSSAGLDGLVQATALLLLATLSPFSLLRLIPMVEAGAVGHLDGLGRRSATRAAGAALQIGGTLRARAAERSSGLGGDGGIPMAAGVPWDHPSVAGLAGHPRPEGPAEHTEAS